MGSFGACRTHTAYRQKHPADLETHKSLAPDLRNMVSCPPLTHTIPKRPFLGDLEKVQHTSPLRSDIFEKLVEN